MKLMNDDEHDEQRKAVVGRPFTPGDERINRRGAPGFARFREIAKRISEEIVTGANGDPISRAEAMLRRWERSRDPRLQALFAGYAFGPVPTKIEAEALQPATRIILRWPQEADRPLDEFDMMPPNVAREMQRRLKRSEDPL